MFEHYFMSVMERLYGRALPAMVAQTGAVPERTMRNWLDGKSIPSERRRADFVQRGMTWLHDGLVEAKWPEDRSNDFFAQIADNAGGASALVHILHWRGGSGCPAALELARRIDTLSLAMGDRREHNDMAGFVELFGTEWLTDEHFNNPDHELGSTALRARTALASVWIDLAMPTAVLLLNLQLQLLATLDHEFSARYLPTFTPVSVFHGLFPDRITLRGGGARSRGAVRLPARRLLDTMACMRYYRKRGKWPTRAPSVDDAAKWMNVLPFTLAKWRIGRQFTLNDFDEAWERMFEDYPERTRPGTPTPLMFAMVMLTRMFVLGSHEKRNLSIAQGGAALYLDWWERQRAVAEAHFDAPLTGTDVWMPGLL